MKKLTSALLGILLIFALCIGAAAAEPKIVDKADLLSGYEESVLEQVAQQFVSDYAIDVVIVTVDGLDGKSGDAYADD